MIKIRMNKCDQLAAVLFPLLLVCIVLSNTLIGSNYSCFVAGDEIRLFLARIVIGHLLEPCFC
jgi:hypothetical protein